MACIFFRLFNIRLGGVDLMPDMFGVLLALVAAKMLRRGEDDFKNVYMPAAFALFFSLGSFVNFMPAEPSAGFGIIYAAVEGGFLVAETAMYGKFFDGYGSMYGIVCTEGKKALLLYAASRVCGIGLNIAVWAAAGNEDLAAVTVIYYVWVFVNIVASTYLAYSFYVLKPKFRRKR